MATNRTPYPFLAFLCIFLVILSSIACAVSNFIPQKTPTPGTPTAAATDTSRPSSLPSTTPSHPVTPSGSAVTRQPTTATPTPQPVQTTPGLTSYSNREYGIGFNYPGDWVLKEEPHFIRLQHGSLLLNIGIQHAYEDLYIGPSGVGAGELQNQGTILFLGQSIPRLALLTQDGKVKAVYYNDPGGIQAGSLMFFISLADTNPDAQLVNIPPEIQAVADEIVKSLRLTSNVYHSPGDPEGFLTYSNPVYGFEFNYPGSWAIQQGTNEVKLQSGNLTLSIGFRHLNENVVLSPGGTGAGSFEVRGTVVFLGQRMLRAVKVLNGKVKAVYYNGTYEYQVGANDPALKLTYLINLSDLSPNYDTTDISTSLQAEADRILESFTTSFTLPQSCSDAATLVQDVIPPSSTGLIGGQVFTKTWVLRNSGSCSWTQQLGLVPFSGDLPESVAVARDANVPQGGVSEFSLEITAPTSKGAHQGSWLLYSGNGRLFGVGPNGDAPLSVQINVGEAGVESGLGDPAWRDTFDGSANWYMLATSNVQYAVTNGTLVMTALNAGTADEWNISYQPAIRNFYLEATFKTGAQCSGLDRYGFLFRAPGPNNGYVLGFSCDGRYRIYKWDGANYTGLVEWTSNSNIHSGPNKTNRMGILAQGDSLKLYANGKILTSITDSSYAEGQFGLFIGSPNTANLQVFVDEVSYWNK